MAQFYGTVRGNRGEASRLGGKDSGLTTVAASWQGSVRVDLIHNHHTGIDTARVYLTPHRGCGEYHLLYEGPVSGKK